MYAHAADPSATPLLPPELRQSDVDLVASARAYLDQGQLGPAIEVAEQAVQRRLTRSRAHLVLAQALAAVRVHHPDQICTWQAWQDRVVDHVRAAWALDGSTLDRIQDDPELADVRAVMAGTLAGRLWPTRGRAWRPTKAPYAVNPTGLPVMHLEGLVKRRHAQDLVVEMVWHGQTQAGEPDGSFLDLRSNGVAYRAVVERDADGTKHAIYTTGSWSLDKQGLHLSVDGEAADMAVTLAGLQVGSGDEGWIRWSDRPVDCTRPFDVWRELVEPMDTDG